jgi:hypothetical protein
MLHARLLWTVLGVATLAVAGCSEDFDTSRQLPPRGTLGEEMYGVLCDRVASQALREDLTGASFRNVCHKGRDGKFSDQVNEAALPGASAGAVDTKGSPVSVDKQKKSRAAAVARIGALVRRRADLIRALDAAFPDIKVAVKDVKNGDDKKSCNDKGQRRLHDELADMLGRFQDLYNDGTIPQSTESLATLMKAFKADPEAQSALARFDSRQGYRPIAVALGALRPILAYPDLRELSNATLRLLSADSDPYAPDPKRDGDGKRIPVPGSANAQFTKLLDVMHQELTNTQADAVPPPLSSKGDPFVDRTILSRPRDNLEMVQTLFYAQDPSFGNSAPAYIVKRDGRGYAQVALANGALPAPFVDADNDGLADVDELGRFVSSSGDAPPTPFFTVASTAGAQRDSFGRVGLYDYIDTSHTFAAHLLDDLKPLVNPNPTFQHETLMYAVAGAQAVFGARDGGPKTTKTYDDGKAVSYDAFHSDSAPMIDLVYALGQLLGDHTTDDLLLYSKTLFTSQLPALARLTGTGLAVKDLGNQHEEAKIPASSTLWDEILDTVVRMTQEPGLLEDVMRAIGNDDTLDLGPSLASFLRNRDRLTYDKNNLNGVPVNLETNDTSALKTPVDRTKPDTGFNRSALQRFVALIHDTLGVTSCNKDGAKVHAKGVPLAGSITLPLVGSYKECEVFKIENLAKFYLDSIVGKAELYFRPGILRNGVLGIGAATVETIEQSSGIGLNANDPYGFWDSPSAKTFRPRPRWLNRLVFFDIDHDTSQPTHDFLADLQGTHMGSAVCPERVIDDPDPGAADASPDGKVHGLRECQDGDWLFQRGQHSIFAWEDYNFYKAFTPTVNAFVLHNREDLLLELLDTIHRHWASDKQAPNECKLGDGRDCSKDGTQSYEAFLADALDGDLLPALHDTIAILDNTTMRRCTNADPRTHTCTASTEIDGIQLLTEAAIAMVSPDYAKANGLRDRAGNVSAARNDGTTNPQVTPIYLLANALGAMDKAFDDYASTHPDDKGRQGQWRAARSQLVDQFLATQGAGTGTAFKNSAVPKIVPTLIDMLRSQMQANCPTSYTPPYDRCNWARDDLTKKVAAVVDGPFFATSMDLMDAIRKNDDARVQLESLVTYLLNAASDNDALPSMLASTADIIQLLRDDTNLVPLFHVIAGATVSTKDQKSLVDASAALLAKISGKAFDKDKAETCNKELDPNQILTAVLSNMVTPMPNEDGTPGLTPLEIIMSVIGDVNRLEPDRTDKLDPNDYASIADNVTDFLLNKERGLEQFYEIVRQGTAR